MQWTLVLSGPWFCLLLSILLSPFEAMLLPCHPESARCLELSLFCLLFISQLMLGLGALED